MNSANLDTLARDLESLGRYAEAEAIRQRIGGVAPCLELDREIREAESSGDWGRWSLLLARRGR